ncbi:MFS general substrate transporter [Mycena sanguinolenta]|uniref:MFS general substrate transporter n=1 Tax=Mycena sanguinolenta TaxID=230812 RepID=A0A8H6YMB4_9AGAR|nr:MFS general substrate transporter [Mycena sanguinolenta]
MPSVLKSWTVLFLLPLERKMAAVPELKNPVATSDSVEVAPRHKVHWFRGTIFQILVIGGVFFCAPGMYNALSALGAGGLATPWYANATAAAGYAFMACMCITGGIIVSKIGVNTSLFIASTGDIMHICWQSIREFEERYTVVSDVRLHYFWHDRWFDVCRGGTYYYLYGLPPVPSSKFNLRFAAYPEESRRGRMLGLWVFMRSAAPVIGGAIIFALNNKIDSSGGVSLRTYLTLIGIMCAGPFISLLLSHPEKVQRKDGVKIAFRKMGWTQTFSEWWKIVCSPDILLLCPLFFTSWFYGSYIGTLQTQYMNVRTRALCAFIIPFGDIAGGFLIGSFLDSQRLTIKQRARLSFIGLMALNLALWVWTAVVTKQLEDEQPVIDWTSGRIFASTFILFILFDLATMATQTSLFWIISQMSDDFIALSYMTGTLRGVECAGQAVAYGIKSSDTTDWLSIGLNVGLIVFSLPFAWTVIRKVGVVPFERISYAIKGEEDSDSVSDEKVGEA